MPRVTTISMSFSNLLTFHFSLSTDTENVVGLPIEPTPPK